eukprot:scaffold96086_cov33-Phaeocystis_antarctica.AAC.1
MEPATACATTCNRMTRIQQPHAPRAAAARIRVAAPQRVCRSQAAAKGDNQRGEPRHACAPAGSSRGRA